MKIETIEVSYSRKVQLQQFEPCEYGETITAVLDEDDDPEAVSEELQGVVEDNVERALLGRIMVAKMEDGEDED
mgnify:CR=1 FL=1